MALDTSFSLKYEPFLIWLIGNIFLNPNKIKRFYNRVLSSDPGFLNHCSGCSSRTNGPVHKKVSQTVLKKITSWYQSIKLCRKSAIWKMFKIF
jgi:hypothetical protein